MFNVQYFNEAWNFVIGMILLSKVLKKLGWFIDSVEKLWLENCPLTSFAWSSDSSASFTIMHSTWKSKSLAGHWRIKICIQMVTETKASKVWSSYWYNCTSANGAVFHSVCQVWLPSGPPEFFTLNYCACLSNWLLIVALGNLPDLRRAQFQISIGRSVVVMAVQFEADLARLWQTEIIEISVKTFNFFA